MHIPGYTPKRKKDACEQASFFCHHRFQPSGFIYKPLAYNTHHIKQHKADNDRTYKLDKEDKKFAWADT